MYGSVSDSGAGSSDNAGGFKAPEVENLECAHLCGMHLGPELVEIEAATIENEAPYELTLTSTLPVGITSPNRAGVTSKTGL